MGQTSKKNFISDSYLFHQKKTSQTLKYGPGISEFLLCLVIPSMSLSNTHAHTPAQCQ